VALFHGMLHVMLWEGLDDTAYIAAHTTGFEALRDRVRDFTPGPGRSVCGLTGGRPVQAHAGLRIRARHPVAEPVLPGPEPEQQRHRQERGADQPAPGHRPDRPPGAGPFS
jgi:hypothetical protein